MRSKCLKASIVALLLAGMGAHYANAGTVLRVFYDNISGSAVSDLVNATNAAGQKIFPNGPNKDGSALQSEYVTGFLEGPPPVSGSGADNYGSMMQGYIQAPQTGAYTFWVTSDDSSELWLSTDATAANKKLIASLSGWANSREYDKAASQKSAAINLVKGQQYYFQVLHKEGGGGDHVSVGWQLPDGTKQRPMPLSYVQGLPNNFWADPSILSGADLQDLTVAENDVATFSLSANASIPINYQWYKGLTPLPITPIADANLSALSFRAKLSDNNTYYRLFIGAKTGVVLSRVAKLTVIADSTAPALTSASASFFDPTRVIVTFSEPVGAASATDPANYTINNGVMVYGVTMGDNASTVVLYTSEISLGVNYKVTVKNIQDAASVPNVLVQADVDFSIPQQITYKVYDGIGGTSTNDFINNALYKAGTYSRLLYKTTLEGNTDFADNYIGQLQAILTPAADGDYVFYVASDDGSTLYLSTDETAANKKPIAQVIAWAGSREYKKEATQKSAPITLKAGKKYYIEAVNKEGGGGDNLAVAWVKPGDADLANSAAPIGAPYLSYYGVLGPISFTKSPASQTVTEGQSVTFTMPGDGLVGTPPYNLQWYKNGAPLAGATNLSVTFTATIADKNAAFTLIAQNNFSLSASANAYLTVNPDTTAPVAQGIAFFTNSVTVIYSKPVDATSGNIANYALKDAGGAAVSILSLNKVSDTTVVLTTPDLTFNAAYTLTVSNVKDLTSSANAVSGAPQTFYPFNAQVARINNTQNFGNTGDKITIEGGGGDIWGTADQFVYAYHEFTGNFDFKVRLENLANSDTWAKAGLMARLTIDAGSRHVSNMGTPQAGQNILTLQYRPTVNLDSSDAPSVRIAAKYPNNWLRLQRVGSIIYAWYSYNGVDWTLHNQKDTSVEGAFPDKILVGLAVTSHTTSATTKAVFSDFGKMPVVPITITTDIANQATVANRTVSFNVTTASVGPFNFQWQRKSPTATDFSNISGATSANFTTAALSVSDSGTKYRCIVSNSTTSTTSPEATITVSADTVGPQIVSAGSLLGAKDLVLKFDEALDPFKAAVAANYTLTGGSQTIVSATYRADGYLVWLKLDQAAAAGMTVGAPGVTDLSNNANTNKVTAAALAMKAQDIGTINTNGAFSDPVEPGFTLVTSDQDFEIQAGGSDIWNAADGAHFVYQEVTGDFDVRVRVESLKYVTDNWAKAGLMVRETTNGNSRNLNMVVDPTKGANVWEQNYRADTGGGSGGWPNSSGVGPVTYPNAWVRIIRQGDQFTALRSTDGVLWEQRGLMTMVFPSKVLVGLTATAHNNTAGTSTYAKFRQFKLGTVQLPQAVSLVGSASFDTATLTFSEPMGASASVAANYAFDNGLAITIVTLDATGKTAVIKTSKQIAGALYNLTMNNIKAASTLALPPNTAKAFSAWVLSPAAVKREVWRGGGITDQLSTLKANAKYQANTPDEVKLLGSFEGPVNEADNYGQRLSGYLLPAITGNYTFYIASDDQSELYLSTDDNPANKVLIAKVASWTNSREYGKEAGQKSAAIALQAGKVYYMEAIMAEGGGGDNLAVTWTLPGDTAAPANGAAPIGGANVATWANPDAAVLAFTTQPKNATVEQGRKASFSAAVYSSLSPVFYQWQKKVGAGNWTDISGANSASYTTAALGLADSGTAYRVLAFIPAAQAVSDAAVVTVTQDITPPEVMGVASLINSTNLMIQFSEPLDQASATDANNYIVYTSGVNPFGTVTLRADKQSVILGMLQPITNKVVLYTENIKDAYGAKILAAFFSSKVINLATTDVGTKNASGVFTDPVTAGSAFGTSAQSLDVIAGGSDIWNAADGMFYVYKQVTGDFDAKVRIASLDRPDNWTKAGLMIRADLDGSSAHVAMMATPTTGQNQFQRAFRATKAGSSDEAETRGGAPQYPNAWVRLQRVGATINTYYGNNGVDWTQLPTSKTQPVFPATAYIGMAVTSHNNGAGIVANAQFRDLAITGAGGASLLNIQRVGQYIVLSWPVDEEAEALTLQGGSPDDGWAPVQQPVVQDGDVNTVTIPIDAAAKMFRLVK